MEFHGEYFLGISCVLGDQYQGVMTDLPSGEGDGWSRVAHKRVAAAKVRRSGAEYVSEAALIYNEGSQRAFTESSLGCVCGLCC